MSKRRQSRGRRRRQQQQQRTLIIVGGVIVLAVAGAFILSNGNPGAGQVAPERLALDPAIGPEDAPITITEFGDFGCPACRTWHNAGIREQLVATYGDQIRFVFKDYPVITAQSPRAAEAAQCALDQGLFWEYHDYVYENYVGLFEPDLQFYAAQVGLDAAEFESCLSSNLHTGTVRNDWQEAQQLGLRGTPSFLINGQPLAGVPSYETFVAQIEAMLASS
jgi:protein-disulfide isomerase